MILITTAGKVGTEAARAGVGHVAKITSKAAADSPIARRRAQAEIEEGLTGSGLDYTFLRNNVDMHQDQKIPFRTGSA